MVNNPKVSVIVPIYNTSIYLEKCLNSLIGQTLKEIEIICINDGSTDNSLKIIENFAQIDSRIKIINQENKGQSVARNVGILASSGEYVGFLDSDDWADEKMFEHLYNNAKKFDSDITMCSISVHDEKTDSTDINDPYMTLNLFPKDHFNKAFDYKECRDFIFRICVTPWNKIYRKSWMELNKISFEEGVNFEDVIFSVLTILKAQKISLIDEPLVFYRKASQTSYSIGNEKKDYKKLDFFKVYDNIEKILKDCQEFVNLKDYFEFHKKNNLIYWYEKITDKKTKKEYKKRLLQIYPAFRLNKLILHFKKNIIRNKIKKLAKNNKLIVWGAGTLVRSVLPKNDKNILGFVDNNSDLHGTVFEGYKVYSIKSLEQLTPDIILAITQNYYKFGKLIESKLADNNFEINIVEFRI